eukprot:6655215-Pyramimonas_sp.AAC.1
MVPAPRSEATIMVETFQESPQDPKALTEYKRWVKQIMADLAKLAIAAFRTNKNAYSIDRKVHKNGKADERLRNTRSRMSMLRDSEAEIQQEIDHIKSCLDVLVQQEEQDQ